MKMTPEEKRVRENFEPGVLSREGFLGKDKRHVHDIVEADARVLEDIGRTAEEIADGLQKWLDAGKAGLEAPVTVEKFRVQVRWDRGKMPCPFAHAGVFPLISVEVTESASGRALRYSQLSVHLIRAHGFFGGLGSVYRIDPRAAADFLGLSGQC